MKAIVSLLLLIILSAAACSHSEPETGPAPVPENYEQELSSWQEDRIETLKEPTGWLRLAGMHILDEGENSFGSGSSRDVQFPDGTIPEYAGTFTLENGDVVMEAADGVDLIHNGEPVHKMTIFNGTDAPEIEHGPLVWFVIQRQDLIAIRLYNKDNEKADRFDGFPRFPVDPEWHLNARFEPHPDSATIPIANVLGQTDQVVSPGTLRFEVNGADYTLDVLESSTDQFFVIVGDETNQTDSYPAGRYMYVDPPKEDGRTIIDFNKLYNPPCAYTVYSTCQLPPRQNRLDLAISAGEKRPEEWKGLCFIHTFVNDSTLKTWNSCVIPSSLFYFFPF
ncbi:MAG: DUF1684 domain-containing protein [Bacteroidetes bacterium]|jgi:uncharacterized protein (DUF1684 family)|nr:DUF1684 domain-containing protein [Bacteroidota bacterium]